MNNVPNKDPWVLLVEDEPLVRMMGMLMFSGAGFQVLEAVDADEAWELLDAGRSVHLLFTDIHVPGLLNGLTLAYRVYRRWPRIPIIVVSGRSTPDPQQLPPGTRFHAKPYDPVKVIRHAHELLAA
jgi:CheY-like chemotaxis protein